MRAKTGERPVRPMRKVSNPPGPQDDTASSACFPKLDFRAGVIGNVEDLKLSAAFDGFVEWFYSPALISSGVSLHANDSVISRNKI